MFRQLRKTLDDEYKVIISRTQILDEYTEAFQKLADAENLPLDKARVRTVLSRYTADEIGLMHIASASRQGDIPMYKDIQELMNRFSSTVFTKL